MLKSIWTCSLSLSFSLSLSLSLSHTHTLTNSLTHLLTFTNTHKNPKCHAQLLPPVLISVVFFFNCNYLESTSVDWRIICSLTELTWLPGRCSKYQTCLSVEIVDFNPAYVSTFGGILNLTTWLCMSSNN